MESDTADVSMGEWQLQISDLSVPGRCSAMFRNELMSDVCFMVGSCRTRIHAHKFILATASPVFFAMLYGPLADKGEIEIPDIESDTFYSMLNYLYTDKLDVDPKNIPSLAYCAKKYFLNRLSEHCFSFLKSSLTKENALFILDGCVLVKEDIMANECLKLIDKQSSSILASTYFTEINLETLKRIIPRDTLDAPEIRIFEAAWRWAQAECSRRNLEGTGQNCRESLGDTLFQIRFPIMKQKDFANLPAKLGLLTNQEIIDLFLYYAADSKPTLSFPVNPRSSAYWKLCERFPLNFIDSRKHSTIFWEEIQFKVNKPILVNGIQVFFRPHKTPADFALVCEIGNSEKCESENVILSSIHEVSSPFHVSFPLPVWIQSNTYYTISVCLEPEVDLHYCLNGEKSLTVDTVTFEFKRSSSSESFLNSLQEGIISAILFKRIADIIP